MKRFLCFSLLLFSMIAVASAQMAAYSPPEQDIGYNTITVATVSVDGIAVVSFDQVLNIVDWQAPTMLEKASDDSAQVLDAYSFSTQVGEVSVAFVQYRWPQNNNELITSSTHYNYSSAQNADAYPFTASRTDII